MVVMAAIPESAMAVTAGTAVMALGGTVDVAAATATAEAAMAEAAMAEAAMGALAVPAVVESQH
jgi:hypothetical protein